MELNFQLLLFFAPIPHYCGWMDTPKRARARVCAFRSIFLTIVCPRRLLFSKRRNLLSTLVTILRSFKLTFRTRISDEHNFPLFWFDRRSEESKLVDRHSAWHWVGPYASVQGELNFFDK